MSQESSFNLIRKVTFTPELKQSLKIMAHYAYDEIYHDLYVADFPSGRLAENAGDIGPHFEELWRSRVSQPLLLGYAFAKPDANLDDLRSALREIGYHFSRLMGGEERDHYDAIQQLCYEAFDQVFAQAEGAPA